MKSKNSILSMKASEIISDLKGTGIFELPYILWFLFTLSLTTSYTASQGFFYLLLVLYIINVFRNRVDGLPPKLYTKIFALFAISYIMAMIFAIDLSSTLRSRNLLIHLLIVFLVCNTKINEKRFFILLYGFFFGSAATSIYGIVQKLYGVKRVSGFFGDYQTLAAVLSISILILVSYLINLERMRKRLITIIIFLLALNLLALYFTFTRSALIGLIFGFIVLFYTKARWTLFVFGSLVFVFIGFSLLNPKSEIGDLVLSIMFPRDRVSSRFIVNKDRIDMYGDSIRIAKMHPITGIGYDTLQIVYHDPEYNLKASKHYTRISSNYFHILVSSGISGLLAYLIYISGTLYLLIRVFKSFREPLYSPFVTGLISAFVFSMIAGLFEPVFFDPKVRFVLYYFIGLSFRLEMLDSKSREQGSLHPGNGGESQQ